MPFFKAPNPETTNISLHDREYDVQNGFVEIPDEHLTPELEGTLTNLLRFAHATAEEISAAMAKIDLSGEQARIADWRTRALALVKLHGLKIDGRKSIEWIRERLGEFVEQGHMPADALKDLDAQVEPPPTAPAAADTSPAQNAEDEKTDAAGAEDDAASKTTEGQQSGA